MQIVFDLIGKCSPYGKPCVHYDGGYRSDSPCGGCERNPKIKHLTDSYEKPHKMVETIEHGPLPGVPDDPSVPPDKLTETEEANRRELGEWGVTLPPRNTRRSSKRAKKRD